MPSSAKVLRPAPAKKAEVPEFLPELPAYLAEPLALIQDDNAHPINKDYFKRRKLTREDKLTFIRIMVANNHLFVRACAKFGIDPMTMRDHIQRDEPFKSALLLAKQNLVEKVEGHLINRALDPKSAPAFLIFWMKKNAKRYADGPSGTAIGVSVALSGNID